MTHRSYGNDEVCSSTVSCRWYRPGRARFGPTPTFTFSLAGAYVSEFPKTKSTDWYALARRRRQRVRIGMRLRGAEDKEYGLVCACAAPKTKSTDWYALTRRRRQRVRIGRRLRGAEDKEKESASALRKKRRKWHARSAEGKRAGIGCVAHRGQRVGSVCAYAALHS